MYNENKHWDKLDKAGLVGKTFSQGVIIPHKMINCSNCKKDSLCDECDKLVNQKKEFTANLNELKENLLMEIVICFLCI